jgi:hypothetical protein
MKSRYQWRALAARSDITTAKIGDSCDAGVFGNDVGIADLQREWVPCIGSMANGLTMAADGANGVKG